MPTGYTSDIKDGISFQAFALNCARAFGACVTLRDEPSGGDQIPAEFVPSDYHSKARATAVELIKSLESMSLNECELKAAAEHTEAEIQRISIIKERSDLRDKYQGVLASVDGWTPPSDDHQELKAFMIEQITTSIRFDCDTTYYDCASPLLTGSEWLVAAKAKAVKDVAYHTNKLEEEVARTNQRNEWVKALRASL